MHSIAEFRPFTLVRYIWPRGSCLLRQREGPLTTGHGLTRIPLRVRPGLRLPPQLCTVTVQASNWRRVFHARSAAACLCAHVQLSGMVMSSCSNCHGTQDCKHPDWVCCPSLLLPAATEVSFTNFTVVWRALRLGPSFRCHGSGDVDAFHNMKTIRPRM